MSTTAVTTSADPATTAPKAAAPRPLAWLLTLGGAFGLLASTVLTVDQIKSLQDPSFRPGCDVNSLLSCSDVMHTWQGNLLGFPNALAGIAGFAALTAVGVLLLAGAALPRWTWTALGAAAAGAGAFVLWLASQCLYVIGALCPWCLGVWAVTLPIAWYTALHAADLHAGPDRPRLSAAVRLGREFHWAVPAVLYGTLAVLTAVRFT